jgi:AhpD family alkylhydroperoxidase
MHTIVSLFENVIGLPDVPALVTIATARREPGVRRGETMSRAEVEADVRETLGIVPGFFGGLPDSLLESEWTSFKTLVLSETAIPNKYKELIGLGVSGATRCKYCAHFHTEAARLFGATEEEIQEASLVAKNTMGWSTYLNSVQYDYDTFIREFDQIAAHVREQQAATV